MPMLYRTVPGTHHNTLYVPENTTLVDFLRPETALVEGMKFLRKGTSAWDGRIGQETRRLQARRTDLPQSDIDALIAENSESEYFPTGETSFGALSYAKGFKKGKPSTCTLVYDRRKGLICSVSFKDRRIDVFRAGAALQTKYP